MTRLRMSSAPLQSRTPTVILNPIAWAGKCRTVRTHGRHGRTLVHLSSVEPFSGYIGGVSFNVAPEAYDRFMGRYSTLLSPQMADLAGIQAGQRVIDVGCGPGALTAELVERA